MNLSVSAKAKYTSLIKNQAHKLGFMYCGVSQADFLEEEAPRLERWLKEHQHGTMQYMERNFDKRLDPRILVPGAKSVVSFLLNYFPAEKQKDPNAPKLSKYAFGEDYHFVIKRKLKDLLSFIRQEIGEVSGRAFVDSAPVLDRAWAKKSGLGWIGKHTNLINKNHGSFFFIAELILDLELEEDGPIADYCGSCTKCIDACPTEAIEAPYQLNASKCISYYTIELKDSIPEEAKGKMNDWMFGCDICQDVCPWNRFSTTHQEPSFDPKKELMEMKKSEWVEITEEVFQRIFKNSAVKRTKYGGLKRNLDFLYDSE